MPQSANIRIDSFLTGIAAGYKNDDYVADQVLPLIPVAEEAGKIGVYGVDHYRIDMNARAMGADTPRGDWSASTPLTFSANEWSFEIPVDDRQRKFYQDPFDAERDATIACMEKILLKREDLVATLMSTDANFGAATAAGTTWATSASATPVSNIRAAILAIVQRTGINPKRMSVVMSYALWNKLVQTTEFKALYLNTVPGAAAPAKITPELAASAIGLSEIIVGSAVKLTSKEGATDAFSDIWSATKVAVFAKAPRPTLMTPGFGALLSPTVALFKGATVAVDKYREEKKRSDVVRAGALFDLITVVKNVGQIITGC